MRLGAPTPRPGESAKSDGAGSTAASLLVASCENVAKQKRRKAPSGSGMHKSGGLAAAVLGLPLLGEGRSPATGELTLAFTRKLKPAGRALTSAFRTKQQSGARRK
jgi:hypothetical protein